jgi:hypothetical protein
MLIRGVPGASCFYMDPGIDTGAVIATREFPSFRLDHLPPLKREEEPLLYGALLHAYDPHLRAMTLLNVVGQAGQSALDNQPVTRQDRIAARAYYWMHPRLRQKLFANLGVRWV